MSGGGTAGPGRRRWWWLVVPTGLMLALIAIGLRQPERVADSAASSGEPRRAEGVRQPLSVLPAADRSADSPSTPRPRAPAAPPGPATPAGLTPPPDAPSPEGGPEPAKRCDVLARVSAGGVPKAGAIVSLFEQPRDDSWSGHAWAPTRHSATTGTEGEATMTGVRPGVYRPVARVAGFTASASPPFRCRGDGAAIEVSLALELAGGCITGRVVDRDGGPLAQSWALLRAAGGYGVAAQIPVTVDEAGRFQACPPAEGQWSLLAGAVGHEPSGKRLTPEDAAGEVVVDLVRTSVIKGRVLGADGPAAGVQVAVQGAVRKGMTTVVTETTDADGRFTVSTGAGAATLSAWSARGWAVASIPPRDEGQDADDIVLTLAPGRTINGRCVDLAGAPCPATGVCFWAEAAQFSGGCVTTGDGGRFSLGNVPPGHELQLASPADPETFRDRLVRVAPGVSDVVIVVVRGSSRGQ